MRWYYIAIPVVLVGAGVGLWWAFRAPVRSTVTAPSPSASPAAREQSGAAAGAPPAGSKSLDQGQANGQDAVGFFSRGLSYLGSL